MRERDDTKSALRELSTHWSCWAGKAELSVSLCPPFGENLLVKKKPSQAELGWGDRALTPLFEPCLQLF